MGALILEYYCTYVLLWTSMCDGGSDNMIAGDLLAGVAVFHRGGFLYSTSAIAAAGAVAVFS